MLKMMIDININKKSRDTLLNFIRIILPPINKIPATYYKLLKNLNIKKTEVKSMCSESFLELNEEFDCDCVEKIRIN